MAAPGSAPTPSDISGWAAATRAITRAGALLRQEQSTAARLHRDAAGAEAGARQETVLRDQLGALVGELAEDQYRGGDLRRLSSYLAAGPDQTVDRLALQQQVHRYVAERFSAAETVRRQRQRRAAAAEARAHGADLTVQAQEQARTNAVGRRQALLVRLANRYGDGYWSPFDNTVAQANDESATPASVTAVSYALAHLGSPYVWGAAGPDEFDCSGLTSQAWAAAGNPIARTSQEQWASLPHVPSGAPLRPGDLVVYFADATHVGMYVGDGTVVQAPRPGTVVRLTTLHRMPVLGIVRPEGTDLSAAQPRSRS